MTELNLITSLDGESYRLLCYIRVLAGEDKTVIWNITREQIQTDLDLSYVTVYKHLNVLKQRKLLEYDGRKKKIKLLA